MHKDKRVNIPRDHSNLKRACTKKQGCKIHGVKTNRTERRNRQIHNYNGRHRTPLPTTERTKGQQISKGAEEPDITINQQDVGDIYEALGPTAAEHSSSPRHVHQDCACPGTRKTNFNKYKEIEIIQNMVSDQNQIELEISNKQKKISKPLETKHSRGGGRGRGGGGAQVGPGTEWELLSHHLPLEAEPSSVSSMLDPGHLSF